MVCDYKNARFLRRGPGPPSKEASSAKIPCSFSNELEPSQGSHILPESARPRSDDHGLSRGTCAPFDLAWEPKPVIQITQSADGTVEILGSKDLQLPTSSSFRDTAADLLQQAIANNAHAHPSSTSDDNGEVLRPQPKSGEESSDKILFSEEINLDDRDRLRQWYEDQFWHMQQIPCKIVAKAWIKAVHPKKQGQNPYNGGRKAKALRITEEYQRGEIAKPDWWPKDALHKEPDHLDARSRVKLLVHILVTMFGKVCGPDGSKKGCVEYWKSATDKVEENIRRQKNGEMAWTLLLELYQIRGWEEKYLRDERDGQTRVALNYRPRNRRSRRDLAAQESHQATKVLHRRKRTLSQSSKEAAPPETKEQSSFDSDSEDTEDVKTSLPSPVSMPETTSSLQSPVKGESMPSHTQGESKLVYDSSGLGISENMNTNGLYQPYIHGQLLPVPSQLQLQESARPPQFLVQQCDLRQSGLSEAASTWPLGPLASLEGVPGTALNWSTPSFNGLPCMGQAYDAQTFYVGNSTVIDNQYAHIATKPIDSTTVMHDDQYTGAATKSILNNRGVERISWQPSQAHYRYTDPGTFMKPEGHYSIDRGRVASGWPYFIEK